MNFIKKAFLIYVVLVLLESFYLTALIAYKYKKPIGNDFWLHLEIAKSYARGELALFKPEFMKPNKGPYPPFFHLFLALFVKFKVPILAGTVMQVIFYPLVLFATLFLVLKKGNKIRASFVPVLMFSSIALFDRTQVIPQAIDMILFPFAIHFFLEKKDMAFIILMLIMIYSHGAFAFLLFASLVVYSLRNNFNISIIKKVLIFSLPLIIITLIYLPSYIISALEIKNEQELLVRTSLRYAIWYVGYPIAFLLPFSLIYYLKKAKNGFELLILLWFIMLLPLLIFYPDRFCSYIIAPASIMISKRLADLTNRNKILGLLCITLLYFIGLVSYTYWFNALHGINYRFDVH